MPPATLEACFEHYINRVQLKSAHTLAAYRRAADLFIAFVHEARLPQYPQQLDDSQLFVKFVEWLLSGTYAYALATVELRLAGVQHWFHYMEDQGWLAVGFSTRQASRLARQRLISQHQADEKAVNPVANLPEIIFYYDTQQPTKSMLNNPESYARWELARLRNRALLHCLAETGGRISELLKLNVADFAQSNFSGIYTVQIIGKSGHHYRLTFRACLAMIRDYLLHRELLPIGEVTRAIPLFISHDNRHQGSRMNRITAWRVVRRAADAVGLDDVSPHDFRHWRAMQLLQEGSSLQEVQDSLGHRSIETVRALYAHLLEG